MDLSLTEAQRLLQRTARDFLERQAPKESIVGLLRSDTGLPEGLWQKAAGLGWLGMLVPPEYGGSGSSLTDAAVLFEELGRGPLPGPFFQSGVLGALLLLEAASAAQRQALLPALAAGREVLTVALLEPNASFGPQGVRLRPQQRDGAYVLDGVKLFVPDALAATRLVVAVRTGEDERHLTLLLVPREAAGLSVRNLPGFLGWQAEVSFQGVTVPASDRLGAEGEGWSALERALEKALPVLCAYAVGGCQAVLEMSVAYSRSRQQFGVPIGRFQRVQDHIIRLVNHLDAARWTTYEALWKLDSGRPAAASVHLAKAVASEAYLEVCNAAHEVHAGIGSLTEYGLVPHTRMSRTLYGYLGDPRWHKRRMADALGW